MPLSDFWIISAKHQDYISRMKWDKYAIGHGND